MIKMLDFTNVEWVDEREIAINDEWLDGILDAHTEDEIAQLRLENNSLQNRRGKLALSVDWIDGTTTAYEDCSGCWGNGIHFI